MSMQELKKLAEEALAVENDPCDDIVRKHLDYLADSANPQTILRMIELMELQHDALMFCGPCNNDHYFEALAAYEAFNRGEG